ncbi:uncharacterized protein V6R79_004320 [Siganus canaliculatus]
MRFLHVSILAGFLLTINADVEDPDCETLINVHRNTVYRKSLGKTLRINCSVTFCNNTPPTITWNRDVNNKTVPVNVTNNGRIQTQWKKISDLEGTSFLIFKKTLDSDAGIYWCQGGDSVGHKIDIYFQDDGQHTTTTTENKTTPSPEIPEGLMMYVYTAAGIVTFVITVIIISVASMHGCKGKPKKNETQTVNQYVAIPMAERPLQSSPPSRRSARRKPPPSRPSEPPLPRNINQGTGQRERSTVEDEGTTIVYAALNHQSLEGAAARPRVRPAEEWSEYAAICVKDHQNGQGR